ncbi:ParB/RepB/Spo0J family partition protein [Flindersiella endophytica]
MVEIVDICDLPVQILMASKHQVRTREVRKDLDELINNIRVHGQLEPIIVSPTEDDGKYEIIAGQRRWLAIKELGLPTVRAAILGKPVNEDDATALSISENLIRHQVDSRDLIDACTTLFRKYGSAKAVAEEVGLPYNKVRSYVKFERLRPQLKVSVEAGELDVATALKIEDRASAANFGEDQTAAMIGDVRGLTKAQRADYFQNAAEADAHSRPADGEVNGYAYNGRPGNVHQILVTMPRQVYEDLREYAGTKRISQDKAAASIIGAYFRARKAG